MDLKYDVMQMIFRFPIKTIPVTYLRITVQIHVRACWKKLVFSQLWGAVRFLPHDIISKFHKAGPLQTGSNASRSSKSFRSRTLFWRVLAIQTSSILLIMDLLRIFCSFLFLSCLVFDISWFIWMSNTCKGIDNSSVTYCIDRLINLLMSSKQHFLSYLIVSGSC